MIGRYPMFTSGFGIVSECSRSRVPSPPQKSTTFIAPVPLVAFPSLSQAGLELPGLTWDMGAFGGRPCAPNGPAVVLILLPGAPCPSAPPPLLAAPRNSDSSVRQYRAATAIRPI